MIFPIILCGGSGTRLWPLSRSGMPKQLQSVHGALTMLQATALRTQGMGVADPLVVCNQSQRFVTRRQLAEMGLSGTLLIAEPVGRNTAPALTLAALHAVSRPAASPDAATDDPVLIVMPADHVIADTPGFRQTLFGALQVAQETIGTDDAIVTFGIVPTEPATGYGYLRTGAAISSNSDARELLQFVEKPGREIAQGYLASGEYLWNSGLFVMRAGVWLRAMAAFAPDMLAACRAALSVARTVGNDCLLDHDTFSTCPADSIDYAVMEKLAAHPETGIRGVVIPLSAGWSDVGAWDSAWAIAEKDSRGNAAVSATDSGGSFIFESSRDNYVRSTGPNAPVIALVGIADTMVVHTPDAILVAHKNCAQDVKKIATTLAERSDSRADLHRKVFRPWGWYDSLGSGPGGAGFQVKHIGVYPGQSLSLQLHHKRAEHWVVVRGTATITVGEHVQDYQPNQHVFIPLGAVHRLENKTGDEVEIIEVQLGSYLGEDDIVRLQDNYSRT